MADSLAWIGDRLGMIKVKLDKPAQVTAGINPMGPSEKISCAKQQYSDGCRKWLWKQNQSYASTF